MIRSYAQSELPMQIVSPYFSHCRLPLLELPVDNACPWLGSLTAFGVAPRRARVGRRTQKYKSPTEVNPVGLLVLATSYSRTAYRRTTIGAAAFHFRVRNGNGWCHCARVTRGPSRAGGCGAWRRRGSLETMSIFQRTADSLISTYRVWEHALQGFVLF